MVVGPLQLAQETSFDLFGTSISLVDLLPVGLSLGPSTIVSGGGAGGGAGGLLDAAFGRLRSPYILVFASVPDGVFLSFLSWAIASDSGRAQTIRK